MSNFLGYLNGYKTSNQCDNLLLNGSMLLSKDVFVCGGTLALELET